MLKSRFTKRLAGVQRARYASKELKCDVMNDFRKQITALASPANIQLGLHPRGVCVGDELVCDFDMRKDSFLEQHVATAEQLNAIRELDTFLDELSGPHNESFWRDTEPIMHDPKWERIRGLSRRVLKAMGWKYSPPNKDGAVYVFQDRTEIYPEDE